MTYNFTDEQYPSLKTTIDAAGTSVTLEDGTPQGDLLTVNFYGEHVQVSIVPPEGWSLDEVLWDSSSTGTLPVPAAGTEVTHNFTYKVSQAGSGTLSSGGAFKIKKLESPD